MAAREGGSTDGRGGARPRACWVGSMVLEDPGRTARGESPERRKPGQPGDDSGESGTEKGLDVEVGDRAAQRHNDRVTRVPRIPQESRSGRLRLAGPLVRVVPGRPRPRPAPAGHPPHGPPGGRPPGTRRHISARDGGGLRGLPADRRVGPRSFRQGVPRSPGRPGLATVALKVATDLFDESQTLARLQHTNIVPIYSIHRVGPLQAVCMPYFGSTTLRDVYEDLENRGTLPVSGRGLLATLYSRRIGPDGPGGPGSSLDEETVSSPAATGRLPGGGRDPIPTGRLVHHIAISRGTDLCPGGPLGGLAWPSGLAHAHERGILHRDLKPANILLTDEGQPMLLDFNLSEDTGPRAEARGDRRDAPIHGAGASRCLPGWSPPGQRPQRPLLARDHPPRVADRQAAVRDAGWPFRGRDRPAHRRSPRAPPAVRPWNEAVTPAVESIILHCLEPDPADRYRTALDSERTWNATRPIAR